VFERSETGLDCCQNRGRDHDHDLVHSLFQGECADPTGRPQTTPLGSSERHRSVPVAR
jgi:hypothetical protein